MALSRHEQFRRDLRDLGIVAKADLAVLWRSVRDARDAKAALMDLLPDLTETYGLAAGSMAADYYDDVRDSVNARGRFSAIVPEVGATDTQSLVAWALSEAKGGDTFRSLVEGGFQKRIANQARNTVQLSSIADPSAQGWMRIGAGGCGFCALLISRGAVYTEESVDFASHDHCNCGAAPAFDSSQVKAVKSEFVHSARRKVDPATGEVQPIPRAERDRVNDWIDANL